MASVPLHPVEASALHAKRERVFLFLAGLFLGTLAMLNILGISLFIPLFSTGEGGGMGTWAASGSGGLSFAIAVGVLPYPLTFLCTDLISELYGKKRANAVVWMGLILNLWVLFILWLGGALPSGLQEVQPGELMPAMEVSAHLQSGQVFGEVRHLAFGAITASMVAYMVAQFCDVHLYHFWKKLTKGRHLWLRNNASTLVSQLVDTTTVILITHFYARALPISPDQELWPQLFLFIGTGYAVKAALALVDTVPFYLLVRWLSRYLEIDPLAEMREGV
jgi:uncharacterized PurR-regulated membrane protein YhhQ (DUF165 family)